VAAEIFEADEMLLVAALNQAVDGLLEMRRAEGDKLRAVVEDCMESLASVGEGIAARREEIVGTLQEDLANRVRSLLVEAGQGLERENSGIQGSELDSGRLVQEVAFLVERSDIREELDRLESHLVQIRGLLESEEPIGRRLDFLSQEILRELNTIGSKCRDAVTTALVVDGKVVCDQFREQAQNIE
jgi:uncharacterized protein (TIGR00255 family)